MSDLQAHEFASRGEFRLLDTLIRAGKALNINHHDEDFGQRTPLHLAAQKGKWLSLSDSTLTRQ